MKEMKNLCWVSDLIHMNRLQFSMCDNYRLFFMIASKIRLHLKQTNLLLCLMIANFFFNTLRPFIISSVNFHKIKQQKEKRNGLFTMKCRSNRCIRCNQCLVYKHLVDICLSIQIYVLAKWNKRNKNLNWNCICLTIIACNRTN